MSIQTPGYLLKTKNHRTVLLSRYDDFPGHLQLIPCEFPLLCFGLHILYRILSFLLCLCILISLMVFGIIIITFVFMIPFIFNSPFILWGFIMVRSLRINNCSFFILSGMLYNTCHKHCRIVRMSLWYSLYALIH